MKNLPTLWSEELGNGIKFVHGEGEAKGVHTWKFKYGMLKSDIREVIFWSKC